ncbi:hypothetical protein HK096_009911 [Nowakowskiella sp. JEL0078]|nr:hypothetical protein HK096_009911 [Nowakowskiella sp. JEL0078]
MEVMKVSPKSKGNIHRIKTHFKSNSSATSTVCRSNSSTSSEESGNNFSTINSTGINSISCPPFTQHPIFNSDFVDRLCQFTTIEARDYLMDIVDANRTEIYDDEGFEVTKKNLVPDLDLAGKRETFKEKGKLWYHKRRSVDNLNAASKINNYTYKFDDEFDVSGRKIEVTSRKLEDKVYQGPEDQPIRKSSDSRHQIIKENEKKFSKKSGGVHSVVSESTAIVDDIIDNDQSDISKSTKITRRPVNSKQEEDEITVDVQKTNKNSRVFSLFHKTSCPSCHSRFQESRSFDENSNTSRMRKIVSWFRDVTKIKKKDTDLCECRLDNTLSTDLTHLENDVTLHSSLTPNNTFQSPPKPVVEPLKVGKTTLQTPVPISLLPGFQYINPEQILTDLKEYTELRSRLQELHQKLASQESYLRQAVAMVTANNTGKPLAAFENNNQEKSPLLEPELELRSLKRQINSSGPSGVLDNWAKRMRGESDGWSGILGDTGSDLLGSRDSESPSETSKSSENAFVCSECGKNFARKFNLQQHIKLHQDKVVKPFACPEPGCLLSFSREYDLKRHHLTVHESEENMPYACTEEGCGMKFPRKDALARHAKKHEK